MVDHVGPVWARSFYTAKERRDWTREEGASYQGPWEFGQVELTERFPPEQAKKKKKPQREREME